MNRKIIKKASGYRETTLWNNSNPYGSLSATTVTLSGYNPDSYDAITVYYIIDPSSDRSVYSDIKALNINPAYFKLYGSIFSTETDEEIGEAIRIVNIIKQGSSWSTTYNLNINYCTYTDLASQQKTTDNTKMIITKVCGVNWK